jgi:hypothetical protein
MNRAVARSLVRVSIEAATEGSQFGAFGWDAAR